MLTTPLLGVTVASSRYVLPIGACVPTIVPAESARWVNYTGSLVCFPSHLSLQGIGFSAQRRAPPHTICHIPALESTGQWQACSAQDRSLAGHTRTGGARMAEQWDESADFVIVGSG